MKKIVLCVLMITQSWALELGGFEVSPELGALMGYNNAVYDYNAGAYARLWLGAGGIVFAPSVRYTAFFDKKSSHENLHNLQYGAALGSNIGLGILRLTPYIGLHSSQYHKFYQDSLSYSAGLKLKPNLIPLAVSVEYVHQQPKVINSDSRHKFNSIQLLFGLHF